MCPSWQYTRNAFILPTDEKTKAKGISKATGIDVDFAQEPPENNMILVDFEGGKVTSPLPNVKIVDESGIDVLMLSPDGKLLARNSALDTDAKNSQIAYIERVKRREDILKPPSRTRARAKEQSEF